MPADRARAVVEALEHEMYTVLATKTDLAAQAQLFNERLERLRAEIREYLARELSEVRLEMRIGDASLREEIRAVDATLREETGTLKDSLREEIRAVDFVLRDELRAGFAEPRLELARLAHALTLRMGAGLAALAGVMVAAQQPL